jgi:hypothetical protein
MMDNHIDPEKTPPMVLLLEAVAETEVAQIAETEVAQIAETEVAQIAETEVAVKGNFAVQCLSE